MVNLYDDNKLCKHENIINDEQNNEYEIDADVECEVYFDALDTSPWLEKINDLSTECSVDKKYSCSNQIAEFSKNLISRLLFNIQISIFSRIFSLKDFYRELRDLSQSHIPFAIRLVRLSELLGRHEKEIPEQYRPLLHHAEELTRLGINFYQLLTIRQETIFSKMRAVAERVESLLSLEIVKKHVPATSLAGLELMPGQIRQLASILSLMQMMPAETSFDEWLRVIEKKEILPSSVQQLLSHYTTLSVQLQERIADFTELDKRYPQPTEGGWIGRISWLQQLLNDEDATRALAPFLPAGAAEMVNLSAPLIGQAGKFPVAGSAAHQLEWIGQQITTPSPELSALLAQQPFSEFINTLSESLSNKGINTALFKSLVTLIDPKASLWVKSLNITSFFLTGIGVRQGVSYALRTGAAMLPGGRLILSGWDWYHSLPEGLSWQDTLVSFTCYLKETINSDPQLLRTLLPEYITQGAQALSPLIELPVGKSWQEVLRWASQQLGHDKEYDWICQRYVELSLLRGVYETLAQNDNSQNEAMLHELSASLKDYLALSTSSSLAGLLDLLPYLPVLGRLQHEIRAMPATDSWCGWMISLLKIIDNHPQLALKELQQRLESQLADFLSECINNGIDTLWSQLPSFDDPLRFPVAEGAAILPERQGVEGERDNKKNLSATESESITPATKSMLTSDEKMQKKTPYTFDDYAAEMRYWQNMSMSSATISLILTLLATGIRFQKYRTGQENQGNNRLLGEIEMVALNDKGKTSNDIEPGQEENALFSRDEPSPQPAVISYLDRILNNPVESLLWMLALGFSLPASVGAFKSYGGAERVRKVNSWKVEAEKAGAAGVLLFPRSLFLPDRIDLALPLSLLISSSLETGDGVNVANKLMNAYTRQHTDEEPLINFLNAPEQIDALGFSHVNQRVIEDAKLRDIENLESQLLLSDCSSVRIDFSTSTGPYTMSMTKKITNGLCDYTFYDPDYGFSIFNTYGNMALFIRDRLRGYDVPDSDVTFTAIDFSSTKQIENNEQNSKLLFEPSPGEISFQNDDILDLIDIFSVDDDSDTDSSDEGGMYNDFSGPEEYLRQRRQVETEEDGNDYEMKKIIDKLKKLSSVLSRINDMQLKENDFSPLSLETMVEIYVDELIGNYNIPKSVLSSQSSLEYKYTLMNVPQALYSEVKTHKEKLTRIATGALRREAQKKSFLGASVAVDYIWPQGVPEKLQERLLDASALQDWLTDKIKHFSNGNQNESINNEIINAICRREITLYLNEEVPNVKNWNDFQPDKELFVVKMNDQVIPDLLFYKNPKSNYHYSGLYISLLSGKSKKIDSESDFVNNREFADFIKAHFSIKDQNSNAMVDKIVPTHEIHTVPKIYHQDLYTELHFHMRRRSVGNEWRFDIPIASGLTFEKTGDIYDKLKMSAEKRLLDNIDTLIYTVSELLYDSLSDLLKTASKILSYSSIFFSPSFATGIGFGLFCLGLEAAGEAMSLKNSDQISEYEKNEQYKKLVTGLVESAFIELIPLDKVRFFKSVSDSKPFKNSLLEQVKELFSSPRFRSEKKLRVLQKEINRKIQEISGYCGTDSVTVSRTKRSPGSGGATGSRTQLCSRVYNYVTMGHLRHILNGESISKEAKAAGINIHFESKAREFIEANRSGRYTPNFGHIYEKYKDNVLKNLNDKFPGKIGKKTFYPQDWDTEKVKIFLSHETTDTIDYIKKIHKHIGKSDSFLSGIEKAMQGKQPSAEGFYKIGNLGDFKLVEKTVNRKTVKELEINNSGKMMYIAESVNPRHDVFEVRSFHKEISSDPSMEAEHLLILDRKQLFEPVTTNPDKSTLVSAYPTGNVRTAETVKLNDPISKSNLSENQGAVKKHLSVPDRKKAKKEADKAKKAKEEEGKKTLQQH